MKGSRLPLKGDSGCAPGRGERLPHCPLKALSPRMDGAGVRRRTVPLLTPGRCPHAARPDGVPGCQKGGQRRPGGAPSPALSQSGARAAPFPAGRGGAAPPPPPAAGACARPAPPPPPSAPGTASRPWPPRRQRTRATACPRASADAFRPHARAGRLREQAGLSRPRDTEHGPIGARRGCRR